MTHPGNEAKTYIAQGEHAVGGAPGEIITTILGSCVAVCLWDPDRSVGGMNHILLPDGKADGRTDGPGLDRFGGAAMEHLINDLVKLGAERGRLRAKVFGGAAMVSGLSDIGARNAAFAADYLKSEGIPCDGESTGGNSARQIRFWPHSGRAMQRFVASAPPPPPKPKPAPKANDVELF